MPTPYEAACAKAQAQADAWAKDDTLARTKGNTPEQVAARQRVVALFLELHCPKDTADARAAKVAQVDCAETVTTLNGRAVDMQNPKAKGFLGLGRKPAYYVSEAFPPQKPEEPIYALEYFPVKR